VPDLRFYSFPTCTRLSHFTAPSFHPFSNFFCDYQTPFIAARASPRLFTLYTFLAAPGRCIPQPTMSFQPPPTVEMANLDLNDQDPFHADATSPNGMMVDPAEELDLDRSESNDIQLLDADNGQADAPPRPVATDCRFQHVSRHLPAVPDSPADSDVPVEAMKEIVLPQLAEEPRILEDAVNTWTVDSWRSLSKKEHGPIFQAGGFPWYDEP